MRRAVALAARSIKTLSNMFNKNQKYRYSVAVGFFCWAALANTAQAEDPADSNPWTLSFAGGGDYSDDASGGAPYAGATLRRSFGSQFLSAGFGYSKTSVGQNATTNNIQAKTLQGTLAYGIDIGRYTLESHASYGSRQFDPVAITRANPIPGRPALSTETASDGGQYGIGASISAEFGALAGLQYAPYVAVDWSRVDTATRRDTVAGSQVEIASTRETGVTGTFGVALTHGFIAARDFPLRLGVDAAVLVSSNGSAFASSSRVGNAILTNASAQAGTNGNQTWGQFGTTLSYDFGRSTTLGVTAQRTVGFKPADYTSAGATLDFRF